MSPNDKKLINNNNTSTSKFKWTKFGLDKIQLRLLRLKTMKKAYLELKSVVAFLILTRRVKIKAF